MILEKTDKALQHLNSITHEGKLIVFATDTDATKKIWYTIKQDGFEDTALSNPEKIDWENWKLLSLPTSAAGTDKSVIDKEEQENTFTGGDGQRQYIVRSVYDSIEKTADAPVQLISGMGYLYLFRQSTDQTLLVDRFTLDGMTNTLVRKLEVRFKRSGEKHRPQTKQGRKNKAGQKFDSLDFKDMGGEYFEEPTTELSLIKNLYKGWFSVVLTPTLEHDQHRWHIFAYNSVSKKIELTSMLASEEGLFSFSDQTIMVPAAEEDQQLIPKSMPGIIQRTLNVANTTVANGFTAVQYDVQHEKETQSPLNGGIQLMKVASRIMLCIPTGKKNTACLDFAIAGDGTLSQVSESYQLESLRKDSKEVMLSANTLDQIRAYGDLEEPAQSQITGLQRAEAADGFVEISTENGEGVAEGDFIDIQQTSEYDGLHRVTTVGENTFEIRLNDGKEDRGLGEWKHIKTEDSTVSFDGSISRYEMAEPGKLIVHALNHGLTEGDEVQIVGTNNYNGRAAVLSADQNKLVINRVWPEAEAINLKLLSRKRKGLEFEPLGCAQRFLDNLDFPKTRTIEFWINPYDHSGFEDIYYESRQSSYLYLGLSQEGKLAIYGLSSAHALTSQTSLRENTWSHVALSFDEKAEQLSLYINGEKDFQYEDVQFDRFGLDNDSIEFQLGGGAFNGQLADVRLWNVVRTQKEVKDHMYVDLKGSEKDLISHWRMKNLLEASPGEKQVFDFSAFGNHLSVRGEIHVGNTTLPRKLSDDRTNVVRYTNDALFAVVQRATYEEQFEFRVLPTSDLSQVDGSGAPIFQPSFWGKNNRRSIDKIDFTNNARFQFEAAGDGWSVAKVRFTVPDGVSLMRAFELKDVSGDWDELQIRKHRVRLVSNTVTRARCEDVIPLDSILKDTEATKREARRDELIHLETQEKLLTRSYLAKYKAYSDFERNSGGNMESQKSAKKQAIQDKETEIASLEKQVTAVQEKITVIREDPYQWVYAIQNVGTGKYLDSNHVKAATVTSGKGHADKQWAREHFITFPGLPTLEYIQNLNPTKTYHWLGVITWITGWVAQTVAKNERDPLGLIPVEGKTNTYYLYIKEHYLEAESGGKIKLAPATTHRKTYKQWRFIEEKLLNGPQAIVYEFQAKINEWNTQINTLTNEISQLRQEVANLELGQATRDQTLTRLKTKYEQEFQRLKAQGEAITDQETSRQANASTGAVSALTLKTFTTDARNLETRAATLDFVRPHGPLSGLASVEGKVLLSYFDARGRMRQTAYDATADSRDSYAEEWVPEDTGLPIPYFADSKAEVTLDEEGYWSLDGEKTLQVWVRPGHYTVLEFAARKTVKILQADNFELSIVDGTIHYRFTDSTGQVEYIGSQNFKIFDPDWIHLCVTRKFQGGNCTLRLYINGQLNHEIIIDNQSGAKPKEGPIKLQFRGKCCDLALWDVALDPQAVETNYHFRLSGYEPGLLAYYPGHPTDEKKLRDLSFNQRHVPCKGLAWRTNTVPHNHPGKKVISFNGDNSYVSLPRHASYQPTGDFTVECWFQAGYDFQDQCIISKPGPSGGLKIGIWNKTLRLYYAGSYWNVHNEPLHGWHHLAFIITRGESNDPITGYLDGQSLNREITFSHISAFSDDPWTIGRTGANSGRPDFFMGKVAEFRIWKGKRSAAKIREHQHRRLTGQENDLIAYLPLDTHTPREIVLDKACASVGNQVEKDYHLPLIGSTLICAEYNKFTVDNQLQRQALMNRFFATVTQEGAQLLAEKRVEELALKWIGNAQFEPTLLGYIEGAPPIPSENLTVQEDYNGATSVALNRSEDVNFSWTRDQEIGTGFNMDLFLGGAWSVSAGAFVSATVTEGQVGFAGSLSTMNTNTKSSRVEAGASTNLVDSLELRGTPEQKARFEHLGKRFVPKNVGYAVVVSSLADVYVSVLKRSRRMVGYQILPVEGVPPDVNTITFLINPAYTMNGSLDGMTGSLATSDRFFRHVPEMRAQFGSLYPASYYRLLEAYGLKEQIDKSDKDREAYFAGFDATKIPALDGLEERETDIDFAGLNQGEFEIEDSNNEEDPNADKKRQEELLDNVEKQKDEIAAKSDAQKDKIDSQISDLKTKIEATSALEQWQKRMENLQIKASKRNIVNAYVWDADGGLRAEEQSFANTVEHTIGGSFSIEGSAGLLADVSVGSLNFALTPLFQGSMTQSMSKTESRSRGFALNVDLSGVESVGITDYNDYPILPGEKVDRYRFMSFYLEGSTQHYRDFFDSVVDPEWLRSNDEEARALRQVQGGKANKPWRILHRVTYVERPALMGFGSSLHQPGNENDSELAQLHNRLQELEKQNASLQEKMEEVLRLLKRG